MSMFEIPVPKIHELKTWSKYFDQIWCKRKTFEIRKNDREFKEGDYLLLREYDPDKKTYSGHHILAEVTYVTDGSGFGIEEGYCVMGINILKRHSAIN